MAFKNEDIYNSVIFKARNLIFLWKNIITPPVHKEYGHIEGVAPRGCVTRVGVAFKNEDIYNSFIFKARNLIFFVK